MNDLHNHIQSITRVWKKAVCNIYVCNRCIMLKLIPRLVQHSYSFVQYMVHFGNILWILYALIRENDKTRFYNKIYALVGQSKLWQVMQELIEISVQFSIKAKYCINCTLQMQILYKILFFEIKNILNLKYKCSWILNSS